MHTMCQTGAIDAVQSEGASDGLNLIDYDSEAEKQSSELSRNTDFRAEQSRAECS